MGAELTGTILKYPGSKNKIADKIIALFPDNYRNMTYLEPFFGSGAVFFQKAPSIIETINDLNEEVYNFFKQVREHGELLAKLVEYTPWSRQELENALIQSESDIENARRFLVRCWFTIGSDGVTRYRSSGWSHNIKDNNGNIYSFAKLPAVIKDVSYRLMPKKDNCVQIENKDAFGLIEKYKNYENVLMYLDPPYVKSTLKVKKKYQVEMSDADHVRLCNLINTSKAKIILSGYENRIYDEHLQGFMKTGIQAYDIKGNKRLEVLWTNYSVANELFDFEHEEATG